MSSGENSTPLRVVPKTNYIGTNFLDAREFSEGSPETGSAMAVRAVGLKSAGQR